MSKALEVRKEKLGKLRDLLTRPNTKKRLEEVLPAHMDVNRLVRTSIYVASTNPDLLNCTEVSFMNACMKAAQLGLEPTGEYGGGHFVRFGDQCTFVPDYRGIIDVARRSGKIRNIKSYVIHENDSYSIDYLSNPPIQHAPCLTGERGRPIAYYAIAWLTDTEVPSFEIMRFDEVNEHRKKLRSGNSDAWRSHFDRMALKTVLLRLCNLLPRSVEMMLVRETSHQADREVVEPTLSMLPDDDIIEVEAEKVTRSEQVLEKIQDDNGKLPKMDELRAMADDIGLDISHLGRQRTAIWELINQTKELEAEGVTVEVIEEDNPSDEDILKVQGDLSLLSSTQIEAIASRCGEMSISMDSSKWSMGDYNNVVNLIKEANTNAISV